MKPVHMARMAGHGVFPGIGDDKQAILASGEHRDRVRDMTLARGNIGVHRLSKEGNVSARTSCASVRGRSFAFVRFL